eukprot:4762057-Prymnesium_polylepis.2
MQRHAIPIIGLRAGNNSAGPCEPGSGQASGGAGTRSRLKSHRAAIRRFGRRLGRHGRRLTGPVTCPSSP